MRAFLRGVVSPFRLFLVSEYLNGFHYDNHPCEGVDEWGRALPQPLVDLGYTQDAPSIVVREGRRG